MNYRRLPLRVILGLAPLLLCVAARASFVPEPVFPVLDPAGSRPAEAVDRQVRIDPWAGIGIESFFNARPQDRAGQAQQLMGVRARSGVPLPDGAAVLEYALAVPDSANATAASGPEHRMFRLRLDSHVRELDYSMRLFDVGEAFASSAPARERLSATGLPAQGQGAEFWAAWSPLEIDLQPRLRRVVRGEGDAQRLEEARSLQVHRALGDALDLSWRIESVTSLLESRGGGDDTRATTSAAVELAGAGWQLFWRDGDSDRRMDGAPLLEWSDQREIGARLELFDGITLAPRYRQQRWQRREASGERLSTGVLGVSSSLSFIPDFDLELEYREREEPGADAIGLGAVLKVHAPLAFIAELPHAFVMDASLSYRDSDALGRPLWDDGVAFQLSFEYRRAALR
jgi:hypothetical protein